ncbi:MAG: hypothetical protein QOI56_1259, partial [Actinomycetota bacterium]|nr:hypothetical protein [Actinomycetota bacterium]
ALVAVRGTIDNTNIALVLVVVVVVAAAGGGRMAGAVTAVVATMAFDFFHTRPYLSLHIESADDLETTILLLAIGLVVGQLALVGWRRREDATEGRGEVERLYRVAEQAAQGAATEDLVVAVRAELGDLLSLGECAYRSGPPPPELPPLSPRGWVDVGRVHRSTDDGPVLPESGFAIPMRSRGLVVGHLVCVPLAGAGVSFERRRVAVALANCLAMVLAVDAVSAPTGRQDGPADR